MVRWWYTKQVANNIIYELSLFYFNLRKDKSILDPTVIQIRFRSMRHINQVLPFQIQHCMTMRVDDLIMKIENIRIFSTKSSLSDKSCCCLRRLWKLHFLCIAISVLRISTPKWHVFICLSIFTLWFSGDTFISD